MVTIKSEREIELMREAGRILAKVHEELGKESGTGYVYQRNRPDV